MKNSLATTQAIARQTLRAPQVPEEARRAFIDRLRALARAHDTLPRKVGKTRAVTSWSLFGSQNWNTLLTRPGS